MLPAWAEFAIHPRGAFDLATAAGFGFGPTEETAARPPEPRMRLAFCVDGYRELAGVDLQQDGDGTVHGTVEGVRDVDAVRAQVARVLSLDHDGEAWAAVGERDPVIGKLQAANPGLRPVLFHSPYEAAAWAVISARRPAAQGARTRDAIARELGAVFGDLAAFPIPARLQQLEPMPGLPATKVERLHAIAGAALAGELDADRLGAIEPDAAMEDVQRLPGIGPFYAMLIVVRATGHADAWGGWSRNEGRTMAAVEHFYGLDAPPSAEHLNELAERWRPFRTWASVLLHSAGRRAGLRPVRA